MAWPPHSVFYGYAPPAIHILGINVFLSCLKSPYFAVAGLSILLYDCFLTSLEEWDVIWSRKWTLPKVVYIINRYGMALLVFYYAAGNTC